MHHEGEVVLPALLARLGLERPVLFGHSDGASIALICAGTHPDRARALVLEAPHVFVEDLSVRSIAAAKQRSRRPTCRAKLGRHHADAAATFAGWNDIWLDPRFRDWNIEAYAGARALPGAADPGRRRRVRHGSAARRDRARVPDAERCSCPAPDTARTATQAASCSTAPPRSSRASRAAGRPRAPSNHAGPDESEEPIRSARRRRDVDGGLARDDDRARRAARRPARAGEVADRRRDARRERGGRGGAAGRARRRAGPGRQTLRARRVVDEPVLRRAQTGLSARDEGDHGFGRPRRGRRRRDASGA